jgi:hypothetical protein
MPPGTVTYISDCSFQSMLVSKHLDWQPSSSYTSPIAARANMSLPVSPCSSPLRQFKQSNWSCLPSPPHPVDYTQNQMRLSTAVPDPWLDIGQLRPPSPYGSPRRYWVWSVGSMTVFRHLRPRVGNRDVLVDKICCNYDYSDLISDALVDYWHWGLCRICKQSLYSNILI